MKFSSETVDQILNELEKIPNIRYVCSKVGIDHSTFYRWLIRHPSFNKEVIQAIYIGRQAICGTAETVIIKGVQNGDFRASTFYLTHNDPQYMQREKGLYYGTLLNNITSTIQKPVTLDGSNFETIFKLLDELTIAYGNEVAQNLGKMVIEHFCNDNQQLAELCLASYERRRLKRLRKKVIGEEINLNESKQEDP